MGLGTPAKANRWQGDLADPETQIRSPFPVRQGKGSGVEGKGEDKHGLSDDAMALGLLTGLALVTLVPSAAGCQATAKLKQFAAVPSFS